MLLQYRQALTQYRQRIYSFAHYSLRAAEDAEDVTQEVFIKLWQHWHKIDHSKLGPWLMRVARNAVVDHVRKQRPAQARLDHFVDTELLAGNEEVDTDMDRDVYSAGLQEAIRQLDDPFRSIIVMRDIQGMSYSEIQECLTMNESQVKVYLHRARRKMRENPNLRKLFETLAPDSCRSSLVQTNEEGSRHG